MKPKTLTSTDHGQATVTAAELLAGATYPPHSIRALARAYLDALQLIADLREVHTRAEAMPAPLELPERLAETYAKLKRCQHGAIPAVDGRATCLPCVWMENGKVDAAFTLCIHDQRVGACRKCDGE